MVGGGNGFDLVVGLGQVIVEDKKESKVDCILYACRWDSQQRFLVGFNGWDDSKPNTYYKVKYIVLLLS